MTSGRTPPPHAVVTGAGSLGSAVAENLAAAGWLVSTTRQNPDEMNTEVIRADAGNDRSLADAVPTIAARGPVIAWVHCVGVASSKQRLLETSTAELVNLFSVNAASLPQMWRHLQPHASADGCHVVVVSSDTTVTLKAGNGAYSASKAALEAFAATLAAEHTTEGVSVTVVRPGRLTTPMRGQPQPNPGGCDTTAVARALARIAATSPPSLGQANLVDLWRLPLA